MHSRRPMMFGSARRRSSQQQQYGMQPLDQHNLRAVPSISVTDMSGSPYHSTTPSPARCSPPYYPPPPTTTTLAAVPRRRATTNNTNNTARSSSEGFFGFGGGREGRRGSFIDNLDSARRRLSNVGDAVSRQISKTIGWKSANNVEEIAEQGTALCKHYIRHKLRRAGLSTRRVGVRINNGGGGDDSASNRSSSPSSHRVASLSSHCYLLHTTYPEIKALGAEIERQRPDLYDRVGRQVGCPLFTSKQRVNDAISEIVREIKKQGELTWCKVVSIYGMAGGVACDCVRQGNPEYVDQIYETMENIMEAYLAPWIVQRGGWSDLSTKFKPDPNCQDDSHFLKICLILAGVVFLIFMLVLVLRLFFL